MITGNILFVGDDLCARVHVLKSVGYTVADCACDADSLRDALAASSYDAILFHCMPTPPPRLLLDLCRALSNAPVVIFADTLSSFEVADFDVVVPGLCSPSAWLPELAAAIALHRERDRAKPPQREPAAADSRELEDERYNSTG